MDLPTITMDRAKAHDAFLDYRRAVAERHSAEDAAVMAGYRALAKGATLINLADAVAAGGLNAQGWPALAVTKADASWCHLDINSSGDVRFSPEPWPASNRTARSGVMRFPALMTRIGATSWSWSNGRAMVPLVPPALRPATGLADYHVLWEVERWERAPRPPGDPALLRRLRGDLYTVVAVWDLTDLERAVLAGRR